ncbi:MAG: biopolymer transporter ExbD [Planctomycetia bacterium]|nr:biopolymer transporter ExbD [Planctomycetia bacterium]
MKTPAAPRSGALGFSMTPMIDVVFLLIIFFLVASHFSRQEVAVEVDLPHAQSGDDVKDDEIARLTLSIPQPGAWYIGQNEIQEENIEEILQMEKARRQGAYQLRIRCAKSIPYGEMEPILILAARLGIGDIQFAVVQ